jgi:hypothetical protein
LLRLREECRLRVFENRVLRRVFVPERDGVTGDIRCYTQTVAPVPLFKLFI